MLIVWMVIDCLCWVQCWCWFLLFWCVVVLVVFDSIEQSVIQYECFCQLCDVLGWFKLCEVECFMLCYVQGLEIVEIVCVIGMNSNYVSVCLYCVVCVLEVCLGESDFIILEVL